MTQEEPKNHTLYRIIGIFTLLLSLSFCYFTNKTVDEVNTNLEKYISEQPKKLQPGLIQYTNAYARLLNSKVTKANSISFAQELGMAVRCIKYLYKYEYGDYKFTEKITDIIHSNTYLDKKYDKADSLMHGFGEMSPDLKDWHKDCAKNPTLIKIIGKGTNP